MTAAVGIRPATLGGPRGLAALALALLAAAIATAWGFELIGGFEPCPLCLEQRLPYYASIPMVAVALALFAAVPVYARVLLALAALVMLYGAGLGAYHAGAEWGFWPGPSTCAGGGGSVRDAAGLLDALATTRPVDCTAVSGRVLGLSFAGWNVVTSSVAALLLGAAATRRRR